MQPESSNDSFLHDGSNMRPSSGRKATFDSNRRASMSPRLPKVKGANEAAQQMAQQLQSRIYTSSSKLENPHFSIGSKRKHVNRLAPISGEVREKFDTNTTRELKIPRC